jgi:hypothetical protein
MSTVRLGIRDNQTAFRPGDVIEGAALWEMDAAPESAELRLVWSTRGKGTEDSEVIATESFAAPKAGDTRTFKLQLPAAPYSFNGQLISLIWAVELVINPGGHFDRIEVVVAPGGREIVLPKVTPSEEEKATLQRA